MPQILGHDCYPVTTAPRAFDITWCNFPYREVPYEPGPKRHPALVLSISVHKHAASGLDYATLQVAYGTSQPQNGRPPYEILHIHNYNALMRAGLCRETWFDLERVQRILWAEEYFPPADHGSPILGKLNHDQIIRLQTVKEVRDAIGLTGGG